MPGAARHSARHAVMGKLLGLVVSSLTTDDGGRRPSPALHLSSGHVCQASVGRA